LPNRERIETGTSYRLIPSKFPPISLFEGLLEPEELETAYALEMITNPRVRDEVGEIAMVPPEERITGPGSSAIMAAFTHIGVPSRFTDGSFGVYYAGLDTPTALAEAQASQVKRMLATDEGPQVIQMRCYVAGIDAVCVDLRGGDEYIQPDSWAVCQEEGKKQRYAGEGAIVYSSIRNPGGECIAAFKTTAIVPPATQGAHYEFHWDGARMTHTSKIISTA